MDWFDSFHGFDLDDNAVLDEKVQTIAHVESSPTIDQWHRSPMGMQQLSYVVDLYR
jgi:hypothetical protein